MYVSLKHPMFTADPYAEFGRRYKAPREAWHEAFHSRYLWSGYDVALLREFLALKYKVEVSERAIRKWIFRTVVYCRAQLAVQHGIKVVTDDYFGDNAKAVLAVRTVRRAAKADLLAGVAD